MLSPAHKENVRNRSAGTDEFDGAPHLVIWIFRGERGHDVRRDEARTAGDEDALSHL